MTLLVVLILTKLKANRCRFKRVAQGWFSTSVVEPCLTFFFKFEVGHLCILWCFWYNVPRYISKGGLLIGPFHTTTVPPERSSNGWNVTGVTSDILPKDNKGDPSEHLCMDLQSSFLLRRQLDPHPSITEPADPLHTGVKGSSLFPSLVTRLYIWDISDYWPRPCITHMSDFIALAFLTWRDFYDIKKWESSFILNTTEADEVCRRCQGLIEERGC